MAEVNEEAAEKLARWKVEAAFFDREAEQSLATVQPIDRRTLHRYGVLRRRRFSKEFRFRLLGDPRGLRILDVGCGDGINSMTLAKLGASVTGIDISPGAIAVARHRAAVNGVESNTTFVCSPLEAADLGGARFDVIWGDAILHHMLDDLDSVLAKLLSWANPGALVVFAEPINLSPMLRRLRFMLPVHTAVTPDERPLEPAELQRIRRWIPDLQIRHFGLLERLNRFVLTAHNLEGASPPRRAVAEALALTDVALFSIPFMRRFAGKCVFYGHVPR